MPHRTSSRFSALQAKCMDRHSASGRRRAARAPRSASDGNVVAGRNRLEKRQKVWRQYGLDGDNVRKLPASRGAASDVGAWASQVVLCSAAAPRVPHATHARASQCSVGQPVLSPVTAAMALAHWGTSSPDNYDVVLASLTSLQSRASLPSRASVDHRARPATDPDRTR